MRSLVVLCVILGLVHADDSHRAAALFRASAERLKNMAVPGQAPSKSASNSLRVADHDMGACGGSYVCWTGEDGNSYTDMGYVSSSSFLTSTCEGRPTETFFHIGKCAPFVDDSSMIIDSVSWDSTGALAYGYLTLFDGPMCTGDVSNGMYPLQGGACHQGQNGDNNMLAYYPTWDSFASTRPLGTLTKVFPGFWSCHFGGNMGWGHHHGVYEPFYVCVESDNGAGFQKNMGCSTTWRAKWVFRSEYATLDDCNTDQNPLPQDNMGSMGTMKMTMMPYCYNDYMGGDDSRFYTVCLDGGMMKM